jgi:hypothetical protein
MSSDVLERRGSAEVSDAIGQLHALGDALLYQMLELIRAYDTSEAWRDDGASSMAAWVSYALGVTTGTGADYVRVARALAHLPVMSATLREGRLSYEQIRALVKVATPVSEAELVEQATGLTATQVEAMVRGLEAVSTAEADEANRRRSLRLRWRGEDRTLRLTGCFPDVDGALVESAIVGIATRSLATPDDPEREPWDARCADALVELASCSVASGPEPGTGAEGSAGAGAGAEPGAANSGAGAEAGAGADGGAGAGVEAGGEPGAGTGAGADADSGARGPRAGAGAAAVAEREAGAGNLQADGEGGSVEGNGGSVQAGPQTVRVEARTAHAEGSRAQGEAVRAEIVVHVEAGALAPGGEGVAALECGVPLAPETVRRLACDGLIRAVAHGADGRPLGVGRRRRTVPRSLLRLLRHRDGGCRFPGCTNTRWVHAHHCQHWADGGPTDLDNILLLCAAHHRFVHEGGWRIEGEPGGELRFVHPDGRRLQVGPPGLRPEVARRLEALGWLLPWAQWAPHGQGPAGTAPPDRPWAGPHDGNQSP